PAMQEKTKQIVTISSIVVVMGLLLAQPIKGLVNEEKTAVSASDEASSKVTFESVSAQAKQGLNASIIQEISTIETQLPNASGPDKIDLLQQLATEWDDVNRPAPLGFVYEELAKLDPKFDYWLKAGDAYRAA